MSRPTQSKLLSYTMCTRRCTWERNIMLFDHQPKSRSMCQGRQRTSSPHADQSGKLGSSHSYCRSGPSSCNLDWVGRSSWCPQTLPCKFMLGKGCKEAREKRPTAGTKPTLVCSSAICSCSARFVLISCLFPSYLSIPYLTPSS